MRTKRNRALRLEDAATRAGLSRKHLEREMLRLGIVKERLGPKSVAIRESELERLIELRKQPILKQAV